MVLGRFDKTAVKGLLKDPEILGSGIGDIIRLPTSILTQPIVSKIILSLLGAGGLIANEAYNKGRYHDIIKSMCNNLAHTYSSTTSNDVEQFGRNFGDAYAGAANANFAALGNAFLKDPADIIADLRRTISGSKRLSGKGFKKFKASFPSKASSAVREITPDIITTYTMGQGYGSQYGDPLSDDDLIAY